MLERIDGILDAEALAALRAIFDEVEAVDGRATAGGPAALAKHNLQLPGDHPRTRDAARIVLAALSRHPGFTVSVLPHRVRAPLFSAYRDGMAYAEHVDAAIMQAGDGPLRTDVAMTLFLSDPRSYEGGELVVQMTGGETAVKLPAGSLVCYPPHFVHRVAPVTRGVRYAAVTWVESLVRNAEQRNVLVQLKRTMDALVERPDAQGEFHAVNNSYQTLLRMWAGA